MQSTLGQKSSLQKTGALLRDNVITVGIVVIAVVVGILEANFVSEANIRNLISNTAIRFIIAVGVSGCLITKGTDLSAGRTVGFASCVAALLLQKPEYNAFVAEHLGVPPIAAVLLFTLVVAAVIGLLNGAVVAVFKVPPFIATLGMQTLVYGVCLVLTGAQPIGYLRADYNGIATGYIESRYVCYAALAALAVALAFWVRKEKKETVPRLITSLGALALAAGAAFLVPTLTASALALPLGLTPGWLCAIADALLVVGAALLLRAPRGADRAASRYVAVLLLGLAVPTTVLLIPDRIFSYIAIIALLIGVFMWFLYNKTRYGKYMYAIGGNENAAEVAGVNTTKSKLLIYMLAAILYGVCGFLIAAKSGGTSVNMAQGYELEAIAGCTIGGVSVNGGVGKISGILIGVLMFELLKVAMQFLGVKSDYTYIVQGLVIIVAVALDLRKYLARK